MPFVIDDIAAIAAEMGEVAAEMGEAAVENSEIAGEVTGASGIIGDGIGEGAFVNEKAIDVGEASDLSIPESNEIIGDGVDESSAVNELNDDIASDEMNSIYSNSEEPTLDNNEECGNPDSLETKKTGGSYGELKAEGWGWNTEPPKEIHHMPSNESSNLETKEGPAIVMDYEDHRQTASCGNSRDAQEYRAKQKELIEQGKFREALQMDIDDIHDKFGDKYDEQIKQMLDYVDELEQNGKI